MASSRLHRVIIAAGVQAGAVGNEQDRAEPGRLLLLLGVIVRGLARSSQMRLMDEKDMAQLVAKIGALSGQGMRVVVDDRAAAIYECDHR